MSLDDRFNLIEPCFDSRDLWIMGPSRLPCHSYKFRLSSYTSCYIHHVFILMIEKQWMQHMELDYEIRRIGHLELLAWQESWSASLKVKWTKSCRFENSCRCCLRKNNLQMSSTSNK